MPKDAKKNIDRYKIRGGDLNEFEFHKNQASLKESLPGNMTPWKSVKEESAITAAATNSVDEKNVTKKTAAAKKVAKTTAGKKGPKKTTAAKKSAKKTAAAKKVAKTTAGKKGAKKAKAGKKSAKKAAAGKKGR